MISLALRRACQLTYHCCRRNLATASKSRRARAIATAPVEDNDTSAQATLLRPKKKSLRTAKTEDTSSVRASSPLNDESSAGNSGALHRYRTAAIDRARVELSSVLNTSTAVTLTGAVTRIIAQKDNGFVSFRFKVDNDKRLSAVTLPTHDAHSATTAADERADDSADETIYKSDITVCGETLTSLQVGQPMTVCGHFVDHAVYGPQLLLRSVSLDVPLSVHALESYLGGGHFSNIGEATARNIVTKFGEDTLQILTDEPERLRGIRGFTDQRITTFKTEWTESTTLRQIHLFLAAHNISPRISAKLLKIYTSQELHHLLTTDPYSLVQVDGIGFIKADAIATKLNMPLRSSKRIEAAILYTLTTAMYDDGHTFLPHNELIKNTINLLNININNNINELNNQKEINQTLLSLIEQRRLRVEDMTDYDQMYSNIDTTINSVTAESSIQQTRSVMDVDENVPLWQDNGTIIDDDHTATRGTVADAAPTINSRIVRGYFAPKAWRYEERLSRDLTRLVAATSRSIDSAYRPITLDAVRDWLKVYETEESGIPLNEEQTAAVIASVTGKVTIITGGPGTGKTHLLSAIVACWKHFGRRRLLTSPTGRGANRMSEVIGHSASTCHRALKVQPWKQQQHSADGKSKDSSIASWLLSQSLDEWHFTHNRQNPLTVDGALVDSVVIDEVSMMDIVLMSHMCAAIPSHAQLVLVGDADQLPSVGVGNVLRDLLYAGVIPVKRLTQVMRQNERSSIIPNAIAVNTGRMPQLHTIDVNNNETTVMSSTDLDNNNTNNNSEFSITDDSLFIDARDNALVEKSLRFVINTLLPQHNMIPTRDLQILTPMHKNTSGAIQLNRLAQAILNPSRSSVSSSSSVTNKQVDEVVYRGTIYRVGDRVCQQKNDYDKGVFNGDVGIITAVQHHPYVSSSSPGDKSTNSRTSSSSSSSSSSPITRSTVTVQYRNGLHINGDDVMDVTYTTDELEDLSLAWAMTIHKSQGSEYPAVIFFIRQEHYVMLHRSLVYTAMTRARRLLIVAGDKRSLFLAVRNAQIRQRYSGLRKRLHNAVRVMRIEMTQRKRIGLDFGEYIVPKQHWATPPDPALITTEPNIQTQEPLQAEEDKEEDNEREHTDSSITTDESQDNVVTISTETSPDDESDSPQQGRRTVMTFM